MGFVCACVRACVHPTVEMHGSSRGTPPSSGHGHEHVANVARLRHQDSQWRVIPVVGGAAAGRQLAEIAGGG